MSITVGINGFGRIGRLVLRAAMQRPDKFRVVGINDLGVDAECRFQRHKCPYIYFLSERRQRDINKYFKISNRYGIHVQV